MVPTELLALPRWGYTPTHRARAGQLWARIGAIGLTIGFRWGGEFRLIKDRPHFEWSGGLTLNDLRRGARPPIFLAQGPRHASDQGELP